MRLPSILLLALAACGAEPATNNPDGGASGRDASAMPPTGAGHAYYTLGDDVFRIAAQEGAVPEDVSAALDRLGVGTRDRWITASPSGAFLVLSADRAGCSGECLVRVDRALSSVTAVLPDGVELSVEGTPAVTDDGARVIYPAKGGPHEIDLFITTLSGDRWTEPRLLTGASTYAYNNMPALDRSGTVVTFDCGAQPYPEDGDNDACEVHLDGSGWVRLVGPDSLPNAREDKVQNPHRGPDGLLFEASWPIDGDTPETIWLLPTAGGAPQPIGRTLQNAVSPCALGDGRFVFLWLGRAGNPAGAHELALAGRDGAVITTLTPGVDVADIGLGCSD